jgi:hypothetical protein
MVLRCSRRRPIYSSKAIFEKTEIISFSLRSGFFEQLNNWNLQRVCDLFDGFDGGISRAAFHI